MFVPVGVVGRYRLEGDRPLLADWFPVVVRVPRGRMLEYVHMGFESIYEKELHIHVEQGRMTGRLVFNNRDPQIGNLPVWLQRLGGRPK